MKLESKISGYTKVASAPTFNAVMGAKGLLYKKQTNATASFALAGNASVYLDGATSATVGTTTRVPLILAQAGFDLYLFQIFVAQSGTGAAWKLTDDSATPINLFGGTSLLPAVANDKLILPDTGSYWVKVTSNKGLYLQVGVAVATTFVTHVTYIAVPNT